jgi:hypothetical protein
MSDDFQNKPRHVYMGLGHILAELERNKIKIKVRGGFLLLMDENGSHTLVHIH